MVGSPKGKTKTRPSLATRPPSLATLPSSPWPGGDRLRRLAGTGGSAGAGAEAFAVPLEFQKATIKPIESLEKMRSLTEELGAFYSMANSRDLIRANSASDAGMAVPIPLVAGDNALGQRQSDLEKMIKVYDRRIEQAVHAIVPQAH